MEKKIKIIILLIILFLFIYISKGVYATNSEKIIVTNWTSLKNVIENSEETEIDIQLSNEESDTWTADSKITISSQQRVNLVSNSSITIKRSNNFLDNMIENNGSLDIMTSSNEINVTLDGNKDLVKATGSLIFVNKGVLKAENIILQNNNKEKSSGGAIYVTNGSDIRIENSILSGNSANSGGAIVMAKEEDNVVLINVKILNNQAKTGSGGGIYAYGNLEISGENTLISNNIAQTYGGGIIVKTNGVLNAGEISNNTATNNAGGGIRIDGRLTMNEGIVKNNYANTTGGGIDWTRGILIFNNGKVENNTITGSQSQDFYPPLNDPNNIDWTKDPTLKIQEIDVELIKSYIKGEDIVTGGLQGMTLTDKYIIFAQVDSNEENTKITIADRNTYTVLNTITDYCFGHASDMAYNPNTDEVFICTSEKKLAKFKINDKYELIDLTYIDTPIRYTGIAYNSDDNGFIVNTATTMYITDTDFNVQYSFDTPKTMTTQGIGYWNHNIFFCLFEEGSAARKIYNKKEKSSNVIYVYNMQGELTKTLYIPNTTLYGEIESCAFEDDGTLVASYNITLNGKSTVSFYKSDILVSNNDKTPANEDDTKAISNNDTIAKSILPNAGEKNILIIIAIFMTISIVMYILLKKHKDVK